MQVPINAVRWNRLLEQLAFTPPRRPSSHERNIRASMRSAEGTLGSRTSDPNKACALTVL
jgi:hypothetical protein